MADWTPVLAADLSGGALVGHQLTMTSVRGVNARQPAMGEPASGHGVNGSIAVVPDRQPLAADGIWRVTLAGEGFGRLVCREDERGDGSGAAEWHLLQLDEITDTQMEAYEAAMLQRE